MISRVNEKGICFAKCLMVLTAEKYLDYFKVPYED